MTADDKNADGTLNDEAFRIDLHVHARLGRRAEGQDRHAAIQISTLRHAQRQGLLPQHRRGRERRSWSRSARSARRSRSARSSSAARAATSPSPATARSRRSTGFGVFLGVGGATGDSFKWPSFLPVKINSIGIQLGRHHQPPRELRADPLGERPEPRRDQRAAVHAARSRASASTRRCWLQGKMPITRIDSLGVTIKGNLFGGTIDAGIVGGILRLDNDFNIIGTTDNSTPVQPARVLPRPAGRLLDGRHGGLHDPRRALRARPAERVHQRRDPRRHPARADDRPDDQQLRRGRRVLQDAAVDRRPDGAALERVRAADHADRRRVAQLAAAQVALQAKTIAANPGQSGFLAAFTVADDDHRLGDDLHDLHLAGGLQRRAC